MDDIKMVKILNARIIGHYSIFNRNGIFYIYFLLNTGEGRIEAKLLLEEDLVKDIMNITESEDWNILEGKFIRIRINGRNEIVMIGSILYEDWYNVKDIKTCQE